jgi:hypothetical protein
MKSEYYLVGMNLLNVAIQSQLQIARVRDILCPYYNELTEEQQNEFDKEIIAIQEKYDKIYEQKRKEEYQKWSEHYDRLLKEKYKGVDIND